MRSVWKREDSIDLEPSKGDKWISMGMKESERVKFELTWRHSNLRIINMVKNREDSLLQFRLQQGQRIQYKKLRILGSGSFGKVYKGEFNDGSLVAVKLVKPRGGNTVWIQREISTLAKLSHPHVINYFGYQIQGEIFEIFMGLKQGSLFSLLSTTKPLTLADDYGFISGFLKEMLQTIHYLTTQGIIHRDIKPENILYMVNPRGERLFQLGDFGLCNNDPSDINSFVGTRAYMAPEVGREPQTNKVDVWSLFMTLVWILDIEKFRIKARNGTNFIDCWSIVVRATETDLKDYREMAEISVSNRASAAQMLIKLYGGEGLNSPEPEIRRFEG
ncbi:kinase-like domain-containing protein [Annulohypoxylon bovei var. microspora]|nr:kinase-like domain-containing protein [Annulohypoxylon bovei var. microspora]